MTIPDATPFCSRFQVLRALHTPDGRYVELDEASFGRIGIDVATLIGRTWKDFAPGAEVDRESDVIGHVLDRETPVDLPWVRRCWSGMSIRLAVTASPVRSPGGARLVLREARVLPGRSVTAPARITDTGPMAALQAMAGLGRRHPI